MLLFVDMSKFLVFIINLGDLEGRDLEWKIDIEG